MPLDLDINMVLNATSDRVKCVDLHPTEPWMLASLHTGRIHVWNHETKQLIKSFEVCDKPVRAATFVARENWIVSGSDDFYIRVFNSTTLDEMNAFEAHTDYVRSIAAHPIHPYILSASDDKLIKLWNWSKNWVCQQIFEGHTNYVMQVVINPKDDNTFASASLDGTIKVWEIDSGAIKLSLECSEKYVNTVNYYPGGDKPYLISGGDDHLVKIWDYENKSCVETLEGHTDNITAVCFQADLPIIITGSEDGTIRLWHSATYQLDSVINYGLGRVWTIALLQNSSKIALGFEEGSIVIRISQEKNPKLVISDKDFEKCSLSSSVRKSEGEANTCDTEIMTKEEE